MVVLNLGGSARLSASELDPVLLQNGQQELGPHGQFIQVPGLAILLRHLSQRFAPLADESSMKGITDLMSFGRLPSESIDAALVRFETCVDRARDLSNFTLSFPGLAWMLLSAFRVPTNMWTQLLAPTQGNLPQNAAEYASLLSYLRRQGHLLEGGHMSLSSAARPGPTYHAYPTTENVNVDTATGMFNGAPFPGSSSSSAAAFPTTTPTTSCPTCGRGDDHYLVDDDNGTDTDDNYEAFPVDEAVNALPPHEQLEEAYFKYRKAKHTWRKLAGRPTRKFRRFRKFGRSRAYLNTSDAYMAGARRNKKNPKDKNGQVMRCHTCNSDEHFKRECPQ